MKKLLITTLLMSTLLVGCGQREVAKVEPIVAEFIGETFESAIEEVVPETEESTLAEIATEVAESITEAVIAEVEVNAGCSVSVDDAYVAEEKVTDDFTYSTKDPFDTNVFITYESSFDKETEEGTEEHYVSEGVNKWEHGCFYTHGGWHKDATHTLSFDDYSLQLYGGYANDEFAVVKWEEEWLQPTEDEAALLHVALNRINAFQITNPAAVETVDDIVYYEAIIDSKYLSGYAVEEGTTIPCKVSFHKSTQEMRGIHITLENALYNGEPIHNLRWNCMLNWGSGIEGTPIGYEEALGIDG